METTIIERPGPAISEYNRPYWEYAKQHELRLQRCSQCGKFWAPPGPVCVHCFSDDYTWDQVGGTGVIATWVRFHKAYHPAFESLLPYVVAFIELTEGPRILTNLVNFGDRALTIGQPVSLLFEDYDGFTLPQFEPAEDA